MKHLIFFMMLFNSCSNDETIDDKLLLNKIPYNGIEIRIDGYYFKFEDNEPIKKNNPTFFYNNGVYLTFGCKEDNDINYCITYSSNIVASNKTGWGLFKIEGNGLYYERWYPKSFGSVFKVFSHECEILNDTTYIVKPRLRS